MASAISSFFRPVNKLVLGRTRVTRRKGRLLKMEINREIRERKRRQARRKLGKPGRRPLFSGLVRRRTRTRFRPTLSAANVPRGIGNPYQSVKSVASKTWRLELTGSSYSVAGGNYELGGVTDFTGAQSLNGCFGYNAGAGLQGVYHLQRSSNMADYVYIGFSIPALNLNALEDTATLTALAALYQNLYIRKVSVTFLFDQGNVSKVPLMKADAGVGITDTQSGPSEHFTYPREKSERINIFNTSGILGDTAWSYMRESGVKIHRTGKMYKMKWTPSLTIAPRVVAGTGSAIPIDVPMQSLSFDDVLAGNQPVSSTPAVVFRMRLPENANSEVTGTIRVDVHYDSIARVQYGFDPTAAY